MNANSRQYRGVTHESDPSGHFLAHIRVTHFHMYFSVLASKYGINKIRLNGVLYFDAILKTKARTIEMMFGY